MVKKENSNHSVNAFGRIYAKGRTDYKVIVKEELQKACDENILYIHDKEHFSNTINCVSVSLKKLIDNGAWLKGTHFTKISSISDVITIATIAVINIENEISGGITLTNFDQDLADIIKEYGLNDSNEDIKKAIRIFFNIINSSNSRVDGSPYLSLSIGVVNDERAKEICKIILDVLKEGTDSNTPYIFPNVQFRVTDKHFLKGSSDEEIFLSSLATTAKQMNPTYLICNSEMNKNINPRDIHVVGCRSRLYQTKKGIDPTGIGRGNIGAISINLPLLARLSNDIEELKKNIVYYMDIAISGLIQKREYLKSNPTLFPPSILHNNLLYPFNKKYFDMLDNASISVGFIGGYESAEIINRKNTCVNDNINTLEEILSFMRKHCDLRSEELNDIITLIGVSGEGLSYKFLEKDKKYHNINDNKEFYTNSFHVPVDIKLRISEKLNLEGRFHKICSGGGISYIEISHVEENIEGLKDIIEIARRNNINYLGFNFDKNICRNCKTSTFDFRKCEICGSHDIIKIRRVSGYLGNLDNFSYGKREEEKLRVKHSGTYKKTISNGT